MKHDNTHQCPIEGCEAGVPTSKLMCRRHWSRVPLVIRDTIEDAARRRQSKRWLAAVRQAEQAVNEEVGRDDAA